MGFGGGCGEGRLDWKADSQVVRDTVSHTVAVTETSQTRQRTKIGNYATKLCAKDLKIQDKNFHKTPKIV